MKNSSGYTHGPRFGRYPTPPSLFFPARSSRPATTYQPLSPPRRQRSVVPVFTPQGHRFRSSRQAGQLSFSQQLDEQRIASRQSSRIVFIQLFKLLVAFSPLLLAAQWFLTSTAERYTQAVSEAEASHLTLIENRSALESLRERLSSPERIRHMAAEKLSLHSPTKGQIEIF